MIVYSLKCAHGHEFDEWFDNSGHFESRQAATDIACPECGDRQVKKGIMAPRLGKAQAAPAPAPCGVPGGCHGGGCGFAH